MGTKNRESKFNSQIKPGLKVLRLFGLAPVNVDTYKPSAWLVLVSIIPTTLCMINAFYEALCQTMLYDMPTTMIILNKLHSACNAASVIFFVLNAAANMKKFANVNRLMNHIDQVLASEKKFLKDFLPDSVLHPHKSPLRKYHLENYMVHLFLFLGLFHFMFDYYIVLQYFQPGLETWLMEIAPLVTILIQRGFVLQLLIIISTKYQKMNKYLMWHKYSYTSPKRNLPHQGQDDLETYGKRYKDIQQEKGKYKIFMNEESIKSFVLIHYELRDVSEIVNEMFCTVLGLLILFDVVRMMIFYYVLSFVIVSMINDTPVRYKYKTFSCFIIWILRLYSEVYFISRNCQDITEEAQATSKILNTLQHKKSSISLAHFFRRSKKMLRRQKVQWSGKIFTLDMDLFFSVGSKVFTYCFILVQFQRQFEMEKFPI